LSQTPSKFDLRIITADDDLDTIVSKINSAAWDDLNEMSSFDAKALASYLNKADTLFVICYEHGSGDETLMGFASSRFEHKPYSAETWLYVDELDVTADHRQRGAGRAIMEKLIEIATEAGCEELWLGADRDNVAANALYQSVDPDDVSDVVGFTYELDD